MTEMAKISGARESEKVIDVAGMSGLGEFEMRERRVGGAKNQERGGEKTEVEGQSGRTEYIYYTVPEERVFLVMRPKTIEVRCDEKLGRVLRKKYETVMVSRYFGRGGIEIVPSGQLTETELEDLVRLSYNLSREEVDEGWEKSGSSIKLSKSS